MISLLLAVLLQATAQIPGTVTGIVRGGGGTPAAGVRVYAIAAKDVAEATATTAPLESQAQTDAAGRYRLEIAPGRYYIASGSVNAPTYFPGTTDISTARVVTVTAGGLVEAVDFSSFVPATRMPGGTIVQGTGVLSGVLLFADGSPAAGITVVAVNASSISGNAASPSSLPIATVQSLITGNAPGAPPLPNITLSIVGRLSLAGTITDNRGAYTLQNLAADTYYVAAGFAESPTLYPGVTDISAAKTITTTPTTNLKLPDLVVPRPLPGVTLSGRVTALAGAPAEGATVDLRAPAGSVPSVFLLPKSYPDQRVLSTDIDGKFQFANVRPGTYTIEAWHSGARESRKVVVADQPVQGIDFSLKLAMLSGRITGEDGTAFPDARSFVDAIVTTTDNPNILASTIFPIAADGTFGRIVEAGDFRFYLRVLPEGYSITSMMAGSVDLKKETLKFTGEAPVNVEVRVARRTASNTGGVSVRGRVVDNLSGAPSPATRITLCCRDSGPVERFSAMVNTDGSFEFASVPPGKYAVGLQAKAGELVAVNDTINVEGPDSSALELVSTPQLTTLAATVVLVGVGPLSVDSPLGVVFTTSNEKAHIAARHGRDGIYTASVPVGDNYKISVTNLPEGYTLKSINGSTEAKPVNSSAAGVPLVLAPIVITLSPPPGR